MKRKIAILMTSVMLSMTLFGCDDPSRPIANAENTAVQDDTANAAENADSVEESASVSDGVSDTGAQTASDDAVSQGDAVSNVSPEGVSFDPEEIVEPEIPVEEVTQPAEMPAETPEEAPAEEVAETAEPVVPEEDKNYDIVFMGDSQFDNARGTASEIPAYTCCLLDKDVKFYNLAIGGTSASLGREDYFDDVSAFNDSCFVGICYALAGKCSSDFLEPYAMIEDFKKVKPENVDLYVIEYGANDYINGKDLFNASNNNDIHTYNGALTEGIETLQKISPNAKFIMCSPSYCVWYNGSGQLIGDSYVISKGIGPLCEYANTASNFAGSSGFMYMDSMYASMFDLKLETVEDYLSDGLHYNEKGRQIYSAVLAHLIQKVRGKDDSEMPYLEFNGFDFWEYKKSIGR
ncbi:SGNH/GDSL hydrolase family protein [Butyrivibrio sp. VCD2006]|uniref:SGNH/GDSL hydrolase family protein n=1 Tax=Butyrivibrio sp. VCD2006 TaxID=1280664 RepID=UPI00040F3043|nr:SGNH/GDSL hydrolase family protein [Butyrivibrio sp. VCD2006]